VLAVRRLRELNAASKAKSSAVLAVPKVEITAESKEEKVADPSLLEADVVAAEVVVVEGSADAPSSDEARPEAEPMDFSEAAAAEPVDEEAVVDAEQEEGIAKDGDDAIAEEAKVAEQPEELVRVAAGEEGDEGFHDVPSESQPDEDGVRCTHLIISSCSAYDPCSKAS
jgi:hypothetical protein